MKNGVKELLKKAEGLIVKDFNSAEEARHYAHELYMEMEKKQAEIQEEKRKLEDLMIELRHAESGVFDYYLRVK